MSALASAETLAINNVITTLNKQLHPKDKINIETVMECYGDSSRVSDDIAKILKKQTKTLKTDYLIDDPRFEINKRKLWTCSILLHFPENIDFVGRGISKKTAEYNSKLTLLLWLREIKKYDPKLKLQVAVHEVVEDIEKKLSITEKNIHWNNYNNIQDIQLRPEVVKKCNNNNNININRSNGGLLSLPQVNPMPSQQSYTSVSHNQYSVSNAMISLINHYVYLHYAFAFLLQQSQYQVFLQSNFPLQSRNNQPYVPPNRNISPGNGEVYSNNARSMRLVNSNLPQSKPPMNCNKNFLNDLLSTTMQHNNCLQKRSLRTEKQTNPVPSDQPVKDTVSKSNESNTVKEIFYDHQGDIKKVLERFPAPKNTLHNFCQMLSEELKNKSLKVEPKYKLVKDKKKSNWICTYHLQWPEEVKVMAKGISKKNTSMMAALTALDWLEKKGRIAKDGLPLILDKTEVKKINKETMPIMKLRKTTISKMNSIVRLYQEKIVPHIVQKKFEENNNHEDAAVFTQEPDDVDLSVVHNQRFLGLNTYLAKEKVDLPIAKYKQDFIKLLRENNVIIVKGEPGCGKSTRVPQYMLEAWAKESVGQPCRIAVTQPRRIAAVSLAQRVSSERDEEVGSVVGYQVRLKSNFRPATGRILYCTTGILLRNLQCDPTLSKFTHVILDEAHERDVNTDLLMNLLRSALKNNPRLKLVVMSATIDAGMFQDYFEGAPAMEIPGFTYPVEQNFLDSCSRLDLSKTLSMCESPAPTVIHDDVVKVIDFIHNHKREGAILVFLPGWEDISKIRRMLPQDSSDLVVYCLHSRLQDSEQWKIFSKPPPGVRKVILATNIAETSVTIDDVVYVVDTGIYKDQRFDVEKGINCLDNHWISKASATQRKGRAGRVQPGESYHLYTRSKFESFQDYTIPEILTTSLTKIVLDCKVFSNNMSSLEFMSQLPTPPDKTATLRAVEELKDLELLDDKENLTSLGKTLAEFQLEPKLAKAMVNSVIFKCVTPIVDIVTLFSAETELFASGLMDKEEVKKVKQQFCNNSDHLAMMRIFEKWLEFTEDGDSYMTQRFCKEISLVPHKMQTIEKLKSIHFGYLHNGLFEVLPISDDYSDNDELVKAVLYSGVGTVLKHRDYDIVKNRLKKNVNVLLTRNNHKATITSNSVNFKRHKFPSDFLLYINETRSNIRRVTLVRECSLISPLSVLLFSNKGLQIEPVNKDEFNNKLESPDQVRLGIQNTNIEFLCDNNQAQDLMRCKDAVMASYQYYIQQLTCDGDYNPEVNSSWNSILDLIDQILEENKI